MTQITLTFGSYEEMVDFARQVIDNEKPAKGEAADKPEPYGRQIAKDFPDANTKAEDKEAEPEEESPAEAAYTLVDIRTALAKLNKEGKKAQVQELIKSFGADKLSQIPADRYPEVMQKAGDL